MLFCMKTNLRFVLSCIVRRRSRTTAIAFAGAEVSAAAASARPLDV